MAFGRKDTQTNPFGEAAPTAATAPAQDDAEHRMRAALRFDTFLAVLFVVLSLGGTALVLVRSEHNALHDPVQKAARGDVIGTDGFSLVNATNLEHAFAVAQAALKPDEQLTNLRLAPDRLDIIVRNTIGNQRNIEIGVDFKAHVISDAGTSSDTGPHGFGDIDAAAPEALADAIFQREGYPPSSLDYLVYDNENGGRWDAYFKQVPVERNHFAGDAHGKVIEQ